MNFEVYLANKWIKPHPPSQAEIRDLFKVADRDIRQSKASALEPEWRFDIAYNAILQLATAVLAASGYEAERQNKHLRIIACLAFTIFGPGSTDLVFLENARTKRNTSIYDRVGEVSEVEAHEMAAYAERFRDRVQTWLRQHHPQLLP